MKISVITPTYNRKQFLPDAMRSVAASILIPFSDVTWEHIVYDDGSTDGTPELFKDGAYPNVKYIRNDINRGQSNARNEAVLAATGDYLCFLDSDDIVVTRALYNFARQAKLFPEKGWFIADYLHVDESLKYEFGGDYYGWDFKDPAAMLDAIWKGEHFIQHNVLVKKQLFIDVGMYDTAVGMGEDIDLFIRFLLKGQMPGQCDFISHLVRRHPSNMSGGITLEQHKKDILKFKKKYEASGLTPLI